MRTRKVFPVLLMFFFFFFLVFPFLVRVRRNHGNVSHIYFLLSHNIKKRTGFVAGETRVSVVAQCRLIRVVAQRCSTFRRAMFVLNTFRAERISTTLNRVNSVRKTEHKLQLHTSCCTIELVRYWILMSRQFQQSKLKSNTQALTSNCKLF